LAYERGPQVGRKYDRHQVTVSLEPVLAERTRRDVAEGEAKSLSGWLNDAGRARAEGEDLAVVLPEIFRDTVGPPTDTELAWARQRHHETVIRSDRADLETIDPTIAVVHCIPEPREKPVRGVMTQRDSFACRPVWCSSMPDGQARP
jgi:hypothetical protein